MTGMLTLNTRAEAVLMKCASIRARRLSATPRNSMENTGAVMASVCWTTASMAAPTT